MIAAKGFYFCPDAEDVGRFVQMPAGDDHRARSHLDQLLPGGFHRGKILNLHAGKKFCLGQVGSNHAYAFEQFIAHEFQSGGVQQFGIPGGRAKNWVEDDVRKLVFVEKFGHRRCITAIRQHSDFHAGNRHVIH